MSPKGKIAIIGSGIIGRNWAILFTSFGYQAQLYDINKDLLKKAPEFIKAELKELCATGAARGSLTLDERMALISTAETLKDCLENVIHVQESVFEDVALKQDIFKQIDEALEADNTSATLASSTSFCLPSVLFKNVSKHIDQCLVAHPINPPMFVRLVEIVLQPKTREDIVTQTKNLFNAVGQKPVVLRKEVGGFALNILQSAVLHQCYSLVQEDILSPEDVDIVVTEGLGPRYAFIGPWMTAHLNANGMSEYFQKYANGLYSIVKDRVITKMEGPVAEKIAESLTKQVPLDKLDEKRAWRDQGLKELDKTKTTLSPL